MNLGIQFTGKTKFEYISMYALYVLYKIGQMLANYQIQYSTF